MPRRTLSPRISTTVTVMSLLMTMLSFFFLDSTSIGAYPFHKPRGRTCCCLFSPKLRTKKPWKTPPTSGRIYRFSPAAFGESLCGGVSRCTSSFGGRDRPEERRGRAACRERFGDGEGPLHQGRAKRVVS